MASILGLKGIFFLRRFEPAGEALQHVETVRGKGFFSAQGKDCFRAGKEAAFHLCLLQGQAAVVDAGKDPAPDWVVLFPGEEGEMGDKRRAADPKFLRQLTPGCLLVTLPGQNHAACCDIKVTRVDVLVLGPLLDKELPF